MISIVIPVHNQLAYTRLCLDSIEGYTPESHEVIVIDNGSTDGTAEYLNDYLATHPNTWIIRNPDNRGYAAANNQGIKRASGEAVLLLNNDTVVSPGWLSQMLAVFERYPDTGLVGPVSNYASGAQFANGGVMSQQARAQKYAGQSLETPRLIGFCMLIRRAVLDKIGPLDERFGLGNFDDDDFCLRAALAGFRARVALDTFVYHAGHATFKGNGFNYGDILTRNWEQFKTKWNLPPTLAYGEDYLPYITRPVTVGVAMLARNCEADLAKSLEPFFGKVDQVAILLGGKSTDDTPALARALADVVGEYDGPLDEVGGLLNFGLARQQSFDLLNTDWAIFAEPDDRWSGVENLRAVLSEAEAEGRKGILLAHDLGGSRFLQTRLFKRTAGHWAYPIHESFQYDDAPNTKTLITNQLAVRQEKSAEHRNNSLARNIRITELYLQDHEDFRARLHLAREYCVASRFEDGLKTADQAMETLPADVTPDNLFQIHFIRAIAYLHLKEYERAMGAAVMALRFINDGAGWALVAQIALFLEVWDLVIYAADRALTLGHNISTMLQLESNVTIAPYHLKAKALARLGQFREALAAVELGLKLGGGEAMAEFKFELCERLGVIP